MPAMAWRRAVLVLLCCALVACDADTPGTDAVPRRPVSTPTGDEETRIIGLVGTMSGEDMWRGEDAFEGADLAVHILNRSIDEGRPRFQLVTLDDKGDPERATELVTELAANEDTVGIVYAGRSEGLPPAERALTVAGIPAVLCYGDLYSARLLRPHLFQASPPYLWQARTIARYLVRDRRYRRVGMLASRSLSGDTAVASLRAALARTRPTRMVVARYRDVGGVPRSTAQLHRRGVDAVVVEGDGHVLSLAARFRDMQAVGFDLGMPAARAFPVGTAVSDSYARGAHFLPIPSFERFRDAFTDWWDGDEPLGWELRAYDAASMIGWAAHRTRPGDDVAATLETLDGARFGGLDVTFGPDDHTAVDQTAVGLWVRPRGAFADLIPTTALPWLPLARGFSIDGDRTVISNRDWKFLFRNPPPPDGPAPRIGRMRYAVTSPRSDPVH
jgi:ABC-type branched-subunit amino acid transport system substrate-binding protein